MDTDYIVCGVSTVDSQCGDVLLGKGKAQGRVTKKHVVEVVALVRRITVARCVRAFGLPDDVAKPQSTALFILSAQLVHQHLADFFVVRGYRGAGGRQHGDRAVVGQEKHLLASRKEQRIVIFGKLAGGREHERHLVAVPQGRDFGNGEHVVARESLHAAVTRIVHQHDALVERFHKVICGLGDPDARRSADVGISTAIHLDWVQSGANGVKNATIDFIGFDIRPHHIVGERQVGEFPIAMSERKVIVSLDFPNDSIGFGGCADGQASYANINVAYTAESLAGSHQPKEVVGAFAH